MRGLSRDDVMRMAQEAGIVVTGEAVWKLCELVAAAEREEYALLVEQLGMEGYGTLFIAAAIRARGQG